MHALFTKGAESELFALIADYWVRKHARLPSSALRRPYCRFGLRERRIVLQGHALYLCERHLRRLLGLRRSKRKRQGDHRELNDTRSYETHIDSPSVFSNELQSGEHTTGSLAHDASRQKGEPKSARLNASVAL
jgi:hypothetical protein